MRQSAANHKTGFALASASYLHVTNLAWCRGAVMEGPKVDLAATKYIRITRLASRANQAALRAKRNGRETEWMIFKERAVKLAFSAIRMCHS